MRPDAAGRPSPQSMLTLKSLPDSPGPEAGKVAKVWFSRLPA